MSKRGYEIMQTLRLRLDVDPEYGELERRRREAEPEFMAALGELTEDGKNTILDFFGISQEMGIREIELACEINGEWKVENGK